MYPMVHATAIVDISMRLYNDTKPEREPGRSSTRVNDGMREDSDAYFNIQLFDKLRRNVDNDPIVTAVANTRHRHTKPKKIIFGCPTRINAVIQYPSVFKVIQQRPATTKELKRKNPLFKTKASQNLRQHPGYQLKEEEKHKGSVLKTDFDCWGCVQHAKKLKVPGNKLANFYQRFNHELVEETIVSFDEEHRINYPTDVINQIKERHNPGENDTYIDTYQDFDFDGLNNQQRAKRLRIE